MKRSPVLLMALVLLAGSVIAIVVLLQKNFSLQVDLATAQRKLETVAKAPPPPARVAAATVPGGRTIGPLTRELMTDALAAETGAEKKLWIRVDPRDREASGFAGEIASVFRDAKWEVQLLDNLGLRFKPGLLMLIGVEGEPPSYVSAAQAAIGAIGQEVATGTGYLSYYESKKRESPDWNGTPFLPEQTYLLVVGRKPDPAAAEAAPAAE